MRYKIYYCSSYVDTEMRYKFIMCLYLLNSEDVVGSDAGDND